MDVEVVNANHQHSVVYRLVPAVLPVLLISIGYVDPGKWAVIVEVGARYGFDLVALMLLFNFAAILCQYMSARIAVVTGRDLAQICREEYDNWTCLFLGVQTELSVILLDLSMVLGIAHGLNLLLGVELSTGVFLAAADAVLFPLFPGLLENYKTNVLWMCMAGIILLSYILGVLISQPEIPLSMNGMLTKFSGDSAFSLMSLLGASMMPHNFYLHSCIVRQHQGQLNISKSALCHDHFFAILCIFSGIYLVNYVLMNSAASFFYSTDVVLLTFQDAMSLMEQVFRSPGAPFAFLLVLFFSNQIRAINWNLCGQVVLQDFLMLDMPGWLHHATIRIIGIVPALYCVWTSGAEGIYQLLIFTQVMVAMMLPSSVIPLFRVASSRSIMGAHKISQFLEFLVLITFMGMLGLKIVFMIEMIFGNSDWVGNLRWNTGSSTTLPFVILLIAACTSLCLMLWLAATPLKSASSRNDAQVGSLDIQRGVETFTGTEIDDLTESRYLREEPLEKQESVPAAGKPVESQPEPYVKSFDHDLPVSIMQSDQEIRLATIEENPNIAFTSPTLCLKEESACPVDSMPTSTGAKEVTGDDLLDSKTLEIESTDLPVKTVVVEGDIRNEKDDDEGSSWEPEESSKDVPESTSSFTSDGPNSCRSLSGRSDDGGNSKLLGRAARRQLAKVLDDFWGQLYDYHGQMTQDGRAKKLDLLLVVDSKPATSLKVDTTAKELSGYIPSVGRGSDSLLSSSLYDSPKPQRVQSSIDSSYGVQRGSSPLCSNNRMQLLDAYVSRLGVQDSGERRYSSLHILSEDYGERRYSSLHIPSEDYGERRYSSLHIPSEDYGERRYSSLHIPSEYYGERRYSSLRIPSEDFGERRYSSLHIPSLEDSGERRYSSLRFPLENTSERQYSSLRIPSEDCGERRYSSLRTTPSSDSWNYQTTAGGSDIAHLSRIARDRNSDFLSGQWESSAPKSPSLGPTNYRDSAAFAVGQKLQNGMSSVQASGFQNLAVSRNTSLQAERSYVDVRSSGPADEKKYHSLPDISGLSIPLRDQYIPHKAAHLDSSTAYKPSVGRADYELSLYSNPASRAGAPLAFDELSPSNAYGDTFPVPLSSGSDTGSLWSRQPFEQFGVPDKTRSVGEGLGNRSNAISQEITSIADAEAKLLQSFRHCIVKILKLEGSEWLFKPNDGADEDLINRVAARESFLYEAEARERNQVVQVGESHYLFSERKLGSTLKNEDADFTNLLVSSVPHCGDGCIWRVDLIISFGVWCIHQILNLSLMESRPELWGKYTYVLNRLQGVIDLAFSRMRSPMSPCFCLQIPSQQRSSPPVSNGMLPPTAKSGSGKFTTSAMLLDLIKEVENVISSRKGRTGTAVGDVAFPKGKENLASVLKRYKRRLSNKPSGTHELRKVPISSAYGS